jgi:hypothetical protein
MRHVFRRFVFVSLLAVVFGVGCPPEEEPSFELLIVNTTAHDVVDVIFEEQTKGTGVSVLNMPIEAGTSQSLQVLLEGLVRDANMIEFELEGNITLQSVADLFDGARIGFVVRGSRIAGSLGVDPFEPM